MEDVKLCINIKWNGFQDEEIYAMYDAMTARELFRKAGVSAKLYRDFLQPILLVTLFAPGEQLSGINLCKVCISWNCMLWALDTQILCSMASWMANQRTNLLLVVVLCKYSTAAAALGALYYYVLAHQADFDVCWCKGSVAEAIFKPWLEVIKSQGCRVLGNNRVVDVIHEVESNKITGIVASKSYDKWFFSDRLLLVPQIISIWIICTLISMSATLECNAYCHCAQVIEMTCFLLLRCAVDGSGERRVYDADVVVFAVGVQAMQVRF